MPIHKALLKHAMFTQFSVTNALARYEMYGAPDGSPAPTDPQRIERFIKALKDMDVGTLWIQLFSRNGDVEDNDQNRALRASLITELGRASIEWAGWGYCAGQNWTTDKDLIPRLQDDLAMPAFMIDAEPGNKIYPNPQFPNDPDKKLPDLWSEADFDAFTSHLTQKLGKDNLALTTWPVLQIQNDVAHGIPLINLMKIAAPRVGLFAPQAYWMGYPTTVHYGFGLTEHDYPRNNSIAFVRLVIKSWRMLGFTNPLSIVGQAYWGERSPSKDTMNGKVRNFSKHFRDWSDIVGFGWYHAGIANTDRSGTMSDEMIAAITQAKLGGKPYKQA